MDDDGFLDDRLSFWSVEEWRFGVSGKELRIGGKNGPVSLGSGNEDSGMLRKGLDGMEAFLDVYFEVGAFTSSSDL